MQMANIEQVLQRIAAKQPFEAVLADGSLYIRAADYPPFFATAIHDGHQLREELRRCCLLSDQQRKHEEDPHTGAMIEALPLVIVARDSRYEYDLNRTPDECIYEQAWGQQVWRSPLTEDQRALSLAKHAAFYRVYRALIERIEKIHGRCLVFDMHSYNTERLGRIDWPHFNLGTSQVARHRFRGTIAFWLQQLAGFSIEKNTLRVAENDVFQGRGYISRFTREHFKNTLVLSTELAKFYCDEKSGDPFPLIVQSISEQLVPAVQKTVRKFTRQRWQRAAPGQKQVSDGIDPILKSLDHELYRLVGKMDVLDHVNPSNQAEARSLFYRNHYHKNPQFHYRPIQLDPFRLKEQLYQLPVDKLDDATLQGLYRDVINAYADKVEQLASIGSSKFLYNSLRYYGEPSARDIANAQFLLHAPPLPEHSPPANIPADKIRELMLDYMRNEGIEGRVKISRTIVASAMVSASQNAVLIKHSAMVNQRQLQALIHHEIGVHLVTTRNAEQQPLKIFSLGLPLNTLTQEGLAILAEYLSGNITLKRLRMLALRVLVIQRMVSGAPFQEVFTWLMDEHGFSADAAFNLSTRAYRGGGFTKDYLYLRGVHDCLKAYREGTCFDDLFIGKTSLNYLPILAELRERELIKPAKFTPPAFSNPQTPDPIMEYIMGAIG